ncbi:PREDICTED: transmembrane protein 68-like [Pygoscelis adeliae]|uniref:transmembrane protein 68-like n=1 Tax=Pygoscelis adeliae TaxID=9238 RepID=UPI0004F4D9D8|nr:PREDICTED: transmembrane protein 68-like [Pygoscelis adeliae]
MGTGQAEGVEMRTKPGEQRGLGEGRARRQGRSEALGAEVGLLLHIYKRKDGLKGHYSNELWDRRRQLVTYLWNLYGKLRHVHGVFGIA